MPGASGSHRSKYGGTAGAHWPIAGASDEGNVQESAIGGCLTHFQALRSQLGGNIRVARLPANGVQDFTLSISAHSIPTQFQQMHRGQTGKSGCMGKPVFPCQIHASINHQQYTPPSYWYAKCHGKGTHHGPCRLHYKSQHWTIVYLLQCNVGV